MTGCISMILQALTVLGIGTALLAYVCNRETPKCGRFAKAVGYLLVVVSLLALIGGGLMAHRCKHGHQCDKSMSMNHNGAMMDASSMAASNMTMGKDGDDKDCDKCPMSKDTKTDVKK